LDLRYGGNGESGCNYQTTNQIQFHRVTPLGLKGQD
jgi:hypothetical protein